MDCNGCEKKGGNVVSYISHEADMSRMERTIRRLWILLIIMLVMLVGTNIGWLMYESQFEDIAIKQDVSQQADVGDNSYNGNIIGGDYYGEATSENYD